MGLFYTASARDITVTAAAQDLFELVNGTTASLIIHQIRLTTQVNTDVRCDLQLLTRSTTGSGGSSAITPAARNPNNSVASKITSFKTQVTTPGSATLLYEADFWSQLAPYEYLWTPETRINVPISGHLCLNMAITNSLPSASSACSLLVTWEEN